MLLAGRRRLTHSALANCIAAPSSACCAQAFNVANGKKLWEAQLPAKAAATPVRLLGGTGDKGSVWAAALQPK